MHRVNGCIQSSLCCFHVIERITMDDIQKLLWGETIDGVSLLEILLMRRQPNHVEMAELMVNMAKAFTRSEVAKARKDIDEFLLKIAIEYFGGMK